MPQRRKRAAKGKRKMSKSFKENAARAMRMHHREGISLKAAWARIKK